MSLESARQFVAKMKEDKQFRAVVQQIGDAMELNDFIASQGFEFNQRELVEAMATCMAELDAISGCSS
jgi:predicted ribosomally synthesized peptide with nif11-like leader